MDQGPFSEKRRHPRVENNISLKICSPDADFVTETKNISSSGVYCRVNKYLEPMTKLQITLLLPIRKSGRSAIKKVSCSGVVVRTENIPNGEGFFTAIFFNDIHSKDGRILTDYVTGALEEKKTPAQP